MGAAGKAPRAPFSRGATTGAWAVPTMRSACGEDRQRVPRPNKKGGQGEEGQREAEPLIVGDLSLQLGLALPVQLAQNRLACKHPQRLALETSSGEAASCMLRAAERGAAAAAHSPRALCLTTGNATARARARCTQVMGEKVKKLGAIFVG